MNDVSQEVALSAMSHPGQLPLTLVAKQQQKCLQLCIHTMTP